MYKVGLRNLKALRNKYHLKQRDIARKMEISEQAYRAKENGHKDFRLSEAKKISELFSFLEARVVTIEEIFFDI